MYRWSEITDRASHKISMKLQQCKMIGKHLGSLVILLYFSELKPWKLILSSHKEKYPITWLGISIYFHLQAGVRKPVLNGACAWLFELCCSWNLSKTDTRNSPWFNPIIQSYSIRILIYQPSTLFSSLTITYSSRRKSIAKEIPRWKNGRPAILISNRLLDKLCAAWPSWTLHCTPLQQFMLLTTTGT